MVEETKRHVHVARLQEDIELPSGYPDKCRECGKDIRDEIHIRSGELGDPDL